MLPPIPQADPTLPARLLGGGVTPEFLRTHTEPPDTLFSPLRLTRAARLNDEPPFPLLRETFCRDDFHVRFVRHLLLYSDYLDEDEPLSVMGAGQTTAVLWNASRPATRLARALDLGCGAGTLALLLAACADRVTATDINPRAVELTRFNAAQNRIGNVEGRSGDLFHPVRGERFDLIVSQPPYYPGTSGPVFLQGGERGTEIASRVLAGIADHLAPGGRAVIHTSLPLDSPTPELPGLQTTEYTPGSGEIEGTRHVILDVAYGSGTRKFEVPAAKWGHWPI